MTHNERPQEQGPHQPRPYRTAQSSGRKGFSLPFWLLIACLGCGAYAFLSNQNPNPSPAQSQRTNNTSSTMDAIPVSQNIVPSSDVSAALAMSGYSQQQQEQIKAAIEKKEAHLVIMPIFDALGSGGTVTVTCGPWSKVITLSSKPAPLILPIVKSGIVNIAPVGPVAQGVGAGIVTIFGAQPLPTIYSPNDMLSLTVSAQ